MSDLLLGIRSIFRAFGLIARDRRVRRLAVAPLIVNVVIVLVGLPALVWLGVTLGGDLVPGSGEWSAAIRVVAQALAIVAFVVIGFVVLLVVARIVAAPLMTRLSEAVEQRVLGERYTPRVTSLRDDLVDVGRGVGFAIGRLVLFLLLYPLILLVGLVPGAGPILAPALTFLYGAFVLSLDFSEPAFERHLPGFRRRMRFVLKRPLVYIGFGGLAFVMALVPVANLVVLPVCVTAATIVFLELREDDIRRA